MESILTSLAASALLAAFAMAQPRYTVTDLGPVGPAPGQPYFITNDGLVSGAVDTPDGTVHAMLWFKRLKLDIGTPGLGGPNNAAFGVNQRGQVVGEAETSDLIIRAGDSLNDTLDFKMLAARPRRGRLSPITTRLDPLVGIGRRP